ncbi:flagellar protein [Alkalicoccobacillus porphyridii]|uniref:Flagellar protein FliT n=1 Tax=Alkalicoccobacillus porphyridii TaxID=2597270 RepID=A0A554A3R7_9BACI|nr:flagellar protein [Alkalicoccobacillus porphyridii]TSB48333.1 flagellar protein [Alkalicoccobacillus porphyridii]
MTILTQLLSQTAELQKHVEQGLPADDDERMEFINQLDAWLVQRGQLIEQLTDHTTDPSEFEIRDELVKRNAVFQENLHQLQNQIRRDLKQIQIKKETGRKYEQPYEGMTDGAFFDKRGV